MKWAAGALVLMLALTGAIVLGSRSPAVATGCVAPVDVAHVDQLTPVAGYRGDQLTNAVAIMNAAVAAGLGRDAQVLGVMTAMGESSLHDIAYGDVAGPDSRGLFQQRTSWGTEAQRMDPATSAALFFARLVGVADWQDMAPSAAAHAVQINADPNHYAPFYEPAKAVVDAIEASGGACTATAPSGTAQQLATALVVKLDDGTLTAPGPPAAQIRAMAAGTATVGCQVDVRILQVITVATVTFSSVGISSLNRYCIGVPTVAMSRHWIDGGGHAVDFYSLGGQATTGATSNALTLIRALDPLMPPGSLVGQAECRVAAGDPITTQRFGQFDDGCSHLHVDVDPTTTTLLGSAG